MHFSRHNTLQRSVRFEEVVLSSTSAGPHASVANRTLVTSEATNAASTANSSETDGLLDALPQPPATFSDPPQPSMTATSMSDDQQRHQLLRIQQHQQRVDINNAPNEPSTTSEAANNRENSVSHSIISSRAVFEALKLSTCNFVMFFIS